MESGGQKGELSSTSTRHQLHTPTGREGPCIASRRKEDFSLSSSEPSQWEAITTLNSCLPLMDIPAKQPPHPNFVFLYKVMFLSFVFWTCL